MNVKKAEMQHVFLDMISDEEIFIYVDYGEPVMDGMSKKASRLLAAARLWNDNPLFSDMCDNALYFIRDIFLSFCWNYGDGPVLESVERFADNLADQVNEEGILEFFTKEQVQEMLMTHPEFDDLYFEWELNVAEGKKERDYLMRRE